MHFYEDVLGKCYYSGCFFLHFQTPLHRQRHPQEDDPVSGWPLLKDTEDQNPSHGWTRSRVPSQWNDQGSTSRPVWEFFCYHRDRKSEMRSAVDRHHGCLHNNITWHACIMWSRSGEWNGNWVNQSRVLVMRLLSARERLQITLFFTVQHYLKMAFKTYKHTFVSLYFKHSCPAWWRLMCISGDCASLNN